MNLLKTLTAMAVLLALSMPTFAGDKVTVEWAPFELKNGVTDEHVIKAAQNVEHGFLINQTGYIKRSLLKGKDGSWVDIVYWKSEEDASNAAAKAYESPICFEYFSLMKGAEHSEVSHVQHFDVVKSWKDS